VGMVATALELGQRLADTRYGLLLNVGVAGSFDRTIALGEVVCVVQDTFSELGVEDGERFIDSDAAGLGQCTYRVNPQHAMLNGLRRSRGITVNTVHGNARSIGEVMARLAPHTESMEGAAVFQAAQHVGIPALQVRAVSNYVERRNKTNWQLPLAITNLNRWLAAFCKHTQAAHTGLKHKNLTDPGS